METLLAHLRKFSRSSHGVAGVEFALILPILLFLFLSSAAFFDFFQQRQAAARSIHAVADILSRETTGIATARLDFMLDILAAVIDRDRNTLAMRVTSLIADSSRVEIDWQKNRGATWPGATFDATSLPTIAQGDSVLVVEVYVPYTTPFSQRVFGGLTDIGTVAVIRPRFVTAIPAS